MSFKTIILLVLSVAVSAQLSVLTSKRTVGVSKFIANIKPIYKSGSTMKGKVVVFTNGITGALMYSGYTIGAEPNIASWNCTTVNGCGAQLHTGVGCRDVAMQGENLFVSPVVSDPWLSEKYDSDSVGQATFAGAVSIGTSRVVGKAFISKFVGNKMD